MEQLSDRVLPQGMTFAWSGLSLEEIKAGAPVDASSSALGLLLVYLTLAAQYESLTLPFIILLSVPLAILGALLAQWGRGLIDDVYCQIGLVMLIGLSAKNGILIVEFAEQLRHRGMSIAEAAVEAARIRLRPILMTSLAFILGVMPLVFASGAGRERAAFGRHRRRRRHDRVDVPEPRVHSGALCRRQEPHGAETCMRRSANGGHYAECARTAALRCSVRVRRAGLSWHSRIAGIRDCRLTRSTAGAVERVTFQQAIERAIANNPSAAVAAAGILRAEGAAAPGAGGDAAAGHRQRHDDDAEHGRGVRGHDGDAAQPGDRVADGRHADRRGRRLGAPRAGARQSCRVAELSAAETRRQIALATADAYLSIIALRRGWSRATCRARDTATGALRSRHRSSSSGAPAAA